MNNAYRVVWNAVTNTWTAVSEHARGHRKGASRSARTATVALTVIAASLGFAASAHAYVAGNGAQQGNANNTVIGDNADGSAAGCNSADLPGSACSTIIGNGASSTAGATTAIGDHASTTGTNATALGAYANAAATDSVALGAGSIADRAQSVSIGSAGNERQITNVAAGTQATDAVNFGQLTNTAQSAATALGGGAAVAANGTIIAPTYTLGGTDYHTVGDALSNLDTRVSTVENNASTGSQYVAVSRTTGPASATGDYSLAVGMSTRSTGVGSVAVGSSASALSNGAIAMGQNARANANNGTAIGYQALASGGNATAFGTNSAVTATNAVGIGNNATAAAGSSIALGSGATVAANANSSIAIGQGATVGAGITNSIALGSSASVGRSNTVSVGGNGTMRQIANMAAGTAANDAVNVGQLAGVTTALGGGASVDSTTGAVIAPTYNVQGGTQNTVGGALDALDGGVKTAQGDISNLDGRVTANETNIANLDGRVTSNETSITNLDGRVSTNETNISNLDGRVTNNETSITNLDGRVTNNETSITNLDGRVTTNETNITNLDSRVTSNETSITNLDGRVTTSETNITNLQQQIGSGTIGLVQQAAPGADLTMGAGTDGARVNFADQGGNARTLANVANGVADSDAVNVSQLKAAQGQIGDLDQLAVKYGDASQASITLGGANGTQIHNVANGTADHDAANVGQLNAAATQLGDQITTINNNLSTLDNRVTNLDNSVTQLGDQIASGKTGLVQQAAAGADLTVGAGTDGAHVNFADKDGNARTLANVANGVADSDAVNVAQLKAAQGQIGDLDQLAVKYGDASQASITLGGANGTQIHNVADGTADHDAANVGQLNAAATQLGDRITTVNNNLTQLGDQVASGKVGLVQQAAAGADLTVGAGTDGARVSFADQNGNARTLTNVANGVADSDAVNVAQLKATQGQIGDLDQLAVKYGDASQASITLGGANGTQIHNVADGTADNDAVNLSQLKNVQAQIGDVGAQLGGAVMYDRLADGSLNFGSVTLGGVGGAAVTLTNVAAGAVNATSTDAVNGSQLYALQAQVDDIGGRVGPVTVKPGSGYFDGTDTSKDAAVTTPVYAGSGAGNTAGGAGATIADGVDNGTALGSNASVTADNAVALGAGSVADRANSVSVGSAGNERTITNVAAGTAPTDAANTQQVNDALKSANSYTDSSVGALSNSMNQRFDDTNRAINQVAKNAYAGIAAAMAMPNMTPSGPGKTVVAAGGATYKGGSAVAAGATYRSRNGNWLVNGAVSVTSTGDAGVRAQVGYEF